MSQRAERVRRPADLLFGLLSLAVVAVVIGSIRTLPLGSTELSGDVSRFLQHIPRWLSSAAAVIAGIGCFLFVILVLFILVRNQWRDARNAGAALVTAAAAAIAVWSVWRAENGVVAHAVIYGKNPTMFVVDSAFVAFLVGSDLVRRSRWSRWCTGSAAALLLTGLAIDTLTPYAVVIVLFGGLMIGWLVRWLLGAASVRPATSDLIAWLTRYGIAVSDLAAADSRDQGRLQGVLTDGTPIDVHLADRDTRGSGLARRLWSLVRLRTVAAGRIPLSSRAQLQQLALASSLAQKAGVPSPSVLLLEEMPNETLVLVVARPRGDPLDGAVSAESATALFTSLRALHDAGIAHRDLRPGNLLITCDSAGFSSLDAAVPGASVLVRRLDLAQLLVTVGRSAGPAIATQALRKGYGPANEAAVAAVMQPVALAPWGWSAMRSAEGCLTQVRHELLGPDTEVPVVRLERFRLRTVLSTFALTIAAYLLIGELSKVNLLGTLGRTNLGWFAVAIAGSALTYFAAAQNLAAFVPKRLSPVRGFLVQVSTAFVGVAMPPSVGHVAVNTRYLHRQGLDESSVAAAVTLSQLVNVVTTVLLLVALGLLTGSGLSRFHIVPGTDALIGLAVIAAAVALLLAIPQTRARLNRIVWPHLRSVWPRLLDALSHPVRLAVSAGANLLLTAGYLLAFFASLYAVGAHPAILPAAVVYLAGNAVGSAAPTPGGLGGVEAVLVAGLTGMGIPAHEAIPAVLVFRVATFWLPIPAGWLAYLGLQRSGTL
ncbi:MAG TPA: lysylphosphatidylglycerol synthase domain-containing protein [Streptosporangiaceae bacterium]|nr:lysylphosphatidylglycerol synthase domain-containing protein [Streptosporangiaceae bacterium]